MVDVIGYDIGGANIKAVFISKQKGKIQKVIIATQYFPIWKKPQNLTKTLLALKRRLAVAKVDGLAVTMTAELSDAYKTKREGVNHILSCVKEAFPDTPISVLNSSTELLPLAFALENPLSVAAANWSATGWLVARQLNDCVVIDVGSTTTSIIPILDGKVVAVGKTDLEKLLFGELVYTGGLRTNVAAIVQSIPINGSVAGVSSELFALTADVHLVLGNITKKDYTTETADGRNKSMLASLARLARVVCGDTEILTRKQIIQTAKYIYERQIQQVADNLAKVYKRIKLYDGKKIPVVITGLGRHFIGQRAAEKLCVDEIIDLGSLVHDEAVYATPAFGVSLMLATKMEGN